MHQVPRTSLPFQYNPSLLIRILRAALRTQLGKRLAYAFGLKGFNKMQYAHFKYVREWDGQPLQRNELVLEVENNGILQRRVFLKPATGFRFNSRVDAGAAVQASVMSGATLGGISSPAVMKYIALSSSTLTPAHGDTTLSGELSTGGLGRAAGTIQNYVAPVSLDGAASYNVYNQFTNTGGSTTVVSTALFDASSSGNMFVEANFSSSVTMATNDILQVTWTINI